MSNFNQSEQIEMFNENDTISHNKLDMEALASVVAAQSEVRLILSNLSMLFAVYEEDENPFVKTLIDKNVANNLYDSMIFIHGCLNNAIEQPTIDA